MYNLNQNLRKAGLSASPKLASKPARPPHRSPLPPLTVPVWTTASAGIITTKQTQPLPAYGSAPIQARADNLPVPDLPWTAAGTISCVKGLRPVLNADLAAGTKVLQWPVPSASVCPIGGFKVVLTGAATFTGWHQRFRDCRGHGHLV